MSLSLAIILNLVFALALIAGLVFTMSRAALLTPHVPAAAAPNRAAKRSYTARDHRRSSHVVAAARS
jgi:hypothetical protein